MACGQRFKDYAMITVTATVTTLTGLLGAILASAIVTATVAPATSATLATAPASLTLTASNHKAGTLS